MIGSKRTTNVKRNIIFATMQVVISQFLPFVVRTILIYRFGVEYLGLNSLFSSILSILSLMELGFGTAVVYSMYKPVADGDVKLICAYLSYYRKIYKIIGLVVLGVGLVLMPFLRFFIYDPVLPGGLYLNICYCVFLGDAVISYLLFGYATATPTAYQRRDILSRVDMAMVGLKCVLQSILLLTSHTFYLYLISIPIVTIVRNLVVAKVVSMRYPEIKCMGDIDPERKRDLNRRVKGLLINKLTTVSRNSIDCLCISAFIGLAITGMYNNYYFVIRAMLSFSGVICNSMMASVGNSIVTESTEKNYNDLRLFDFIYMAIAGWATVCMLCLYQPFISTWIGDKMMLDLPVAIGLSIYFYILKSGDIRWVYHEGAGLWYEARIIMIGEAIANIVLNVLLCRVWGVFGVVLATIISVFITNMILCPKLIFRLYFKNGKLEEYWRDHISYTATMALTSVISYAICELTLPGSGIGILVGRFIICSIISIAVFWLIWRKSRRYDMAMSWMKKIVDFQHN